MNEAVPAPTIRHPDGRVLLFSCEEFVEEICRGNHCFVCGASKDTKAFNDEHIVPRWVLRRFGLFDKSITLPTGELRRYGGYCVPCCVECNDLLGRTVEAPVSKLLEGTVDEVAGRLDANARETLYVWMALLFLKTHLKDNLVPVERDRRIEAGLIGDIHDWADLHHLHAIARSPYTSARISPGVVGTLCLFEVIDDISDDDFDYVDLSLDQTVAVRIGRIGIISVFNDSGAAARAWSHRLSKITGPLNGVQFREVAALLACANRDLMNRPNYGTLVSRDLDRTIIFCGHVPEPDFAPYDPVAFGHKLHFVLGSRLRALEIDGSKDPDYVSEAIRGGQVSFLFDEKDNFRQLADPSRLAG